MSKGRKINEIIKYYGKGVTPRYVPHSSIIVLNQKCIRNNRIDYSFAQFIDDSKEYTENKLLKEGDILINSTGQGTAGRVAFVDKIPDGYQLIVDSHILVLRTKNFYESRCLNYSLFSIEKILQTFIDGSTGQGEFDKTRLFNVKLNYSEDLVEQMHISSILSSLDTKIELNQKINTELEAMARTLYEYWFLQFDFPDKNGSPYKFSGGKMVYNEVLKQKIPREWYPGKLNDIVTFNPNLSLKVGREYSYIDMNALPTFGYMTSSIQKKEFNGGLKFQNGDVVVARITPCLENGKTALITLLENEEVAFGSTEFIVLRGKKVDIRSFIACLSRSDLFRKYAIANMTGTSGRKRVESKSLEVFPLAIPPNDLLLKFENLVRPAFEKMTINQKENHELSQLRDWLLPMLMNGQVKVADRRIEKNGLVTVAAETMPGNINQTSLAIPANKKGFARQVLAGKIVSLFKSDPNFTEIKFQKIQFLAEHIAAADLNLNYYYQAAGPYDNKFMHTIHDSFKKSKWFDWKNKQYIPLEKQNKIDDFYQGYFQPVQGLLETLFELLSNATEAESEIIATIYAVWNNRIIDGKSFKDDDLIQDFYNWSERKQQYSEKQIMKGLEWIRINQMEPKGFGKVIKKAKRKSK